jgi:hypothetical protein
MLAADGAKACEPDIRTETKRRTGRKRDDCIMVVVVYEYKQGDGRGKEEGLLWVYATKDKRSCSSTRKTSLGKIRGAVSLLISIVSVRVYNTHDGVFGRTLERTLCSGTRRIFVF